MVEQKLQVVKSLLNHKNKGPGTSVFDHCLVLGEENNKNIKMVCVYNLWHTDLLSRISTTGIANASVFPDPVTCGRLEASEGRLHMIE